MERAVVDDDLRQLLAERQRVDQFVRINARRGIRRDVADVVRARALAAQAHRLDAAQKLRRVLRLDEAQLQVGPRGDLDVAAGQLLRNLGRLAQLKRLEHAAGNFQPAHELLAGGCEIKQPVPLEAVDVFLVRSAIGDGVFEQERIGIQRIQFALHAFLEDQVRRVRHRLGHGVGRDAGKGQPAFAQAGKKSVQIRALLVRQLLALDGIEGGRFAHASKGRGGQFGRGINRHRVDNVWPT